jgi:hypothetical protein
MSASPQAPDLTDIRGVRGLLARSGQLINTKHPANGRVSLANLVSVSSVAGLEWGNFYLPSMRSRFANAARTWRFCSSVAGDVGLLA